MTHDFSGEGAGTTAAASPRRDDAAAELPHPHPARVAWAADRWFVTAALLYVVLSLVVGAAVGWRRPGVALLGYLASWILPAIYAALYLFHLRRRLDAAGSLGVRDAWLRTWREARRTTFSDERLIGAALVLAAYSLFATFFTAWKLSIPLVNPYGWDATLAAADRWLHGGTDPWRLTHALFGSEFATRVLDALYLPVWALLNSVAIAVAAIAPPSGLRQRYLLAYLVTWIALGTVAAVALSSVGPPFLGEVAGSAADAAPFAPLRAALAAMDAGFPLTSVRGQRILLTIALAREAPMAGTGISAMPSLHVASMVVVALAARHVSPRLGRVAAAYAVIVLVGSVHLGWHYALDGYVGALGAALIWWLVGLGARGRRARG